MTSLGSDPRPRSYTRRNMISVQSDSGKYFRLAVIVVLSAVLVWLSACGGQAAQSDGSPEGGGAGESVASHYAGTWVNSDDPGDLSKWNTVVFEVSDGRMSLTDKGEWILTIEDGRMSRSYGDWYDSIEGPDDVVLTLSRDDEGRSGYGPDEDFHGRWLPVGLPPEWSEWPSGGSPEVVVLTGSTLKEVYGAGEGALSIYPSGTTQYLFDGDMLTRMTGMSPEYHTYYTRQGSSSGTSELGE